MTSVCQEVEPVVCLHGGRVVVHEAMYFHLHIRSNILSEKLLSSQHQK
jgi:hypothetical protein